MQIDIENPPKNYNVLYADPPWRFETYSQKGKGKSADKHYPCMSIFDIDNMPISNVASKNCILFLWVTDPYLERSLETIKKWGFKYKTVGFTWVKKNKSGSGIFMGTGYYTRSNPEMCLIATKGKPGLPKSRSISQVIFEPLREHSRKPDITRENIEEMYDGPYLELFARTTKDGWDCYGNEVEKF